MRRYGRQECLHELRELSIRVDNDSRRSTGRRGWPFDVAVDVENRCGREEPFASARGADRLAVLVCLGHERDGRWCRRQHLRAGLRSRNVHGVEQDGTCRQERRIYRYRRSIACRHRPAVRSHEFDLRARAGKGRANAFDRVGIDAVRDEKCDHPRRDRVRNRTCHAQRGRRLEHRRDAALDQVHWLIEELRVSLFAQSLGTAGSVSEKKVLAAIAALA